MGKVLFIRVSAVTYDEKDVLKFWPKLYGLAWPDDKGCAIIGPPVKGVVELAQALPELVRFGVVSEPEKTVLTPFMDALERQSTALERALGDQDVAAAKKAANDIENSLDMAEEALK